MMSTLRVMLEHAQTAATLFTLLGMPTMVGASAFGKLPRVGPGRALTLGLSSRFSSPPTKPSEREDDVSRLQSSLNSVVYDRPGFIKSPDVFWVVQGPKGVGECSSWSVNVQVSSLFTFKILPTLLFNSMRPHIPPTICAGKTCIVNTATERQMGVVHVTVAAAASHEKNSVGCAALCVPYATEQRLPSTVSRARSALPPPFL